MFSKLRNNNKRRVGKTDREEMTVKKENAGDVCIKGESKKRIEICLMTPSQNIDGRGLYSG